MVTIKMLKPYYLKADDNHVKVILAYQYFAVFVNKQVYQFVPIEAKEIRINRRTKKVENIGAKFAFQKGKDILYMTLSELISLPDFLVHLHSIAEPYFIEQTDDQLPTNENAIIERLEQENLKRLIDKSLDDRNYEAFQSLVKLL